MIVIILIIIGLLVWIAEKRQKKGYIKKQGVEIHPLLKSNA